MFPNHCRILYTPYFDFIEGSSPVFGYYFFNGLLMMLQVLHVFWFYLILHMIYRLIWKGKVSGEWQEVGFHLLNSKGKWEEPG